jgi:hypothetical protein
MLLSSRIFLGNNVPASGTEVIPGTASLTLTTFAPTVTVTANQNVTPGPATLTLTTFAPTVSTPRNVIPGTAALTLTTFAPTVSTGNNIEVIPGSASLTLQTFAPTVQAGNNIEVIPGTASLTLTTFAPTVEASIDDIPVIIIGGDDAPRKRRRKEQDFNAIYREIEATVHRLLYPEPDALPEAVDEYQAAREARRDLDELAVLAEGQHALLQRAAALRSDLQRIEESRERTRAALEQDEEDALIWMF